RSDVARKTNDRFLTAPSATAEMAQRGKREAHSAFPHAGFAHRISPIPTSGSSSNAHRLSGPAPGPARGGHKSMRVERDRRCFAHFLPVDAYARQGADRGDQLNFHHPY